MEISDEESIQVAIKSVKYSTQKEKKNFVKEMCVMFRMFHPNIVRLHGIVLEGTTSGVAGNLIVLEYMHYGDLLTFLKVLCSCSHVALAWSLNVCNLYSKMTALFRN